MKTRTSRKASRRDAFISHASKDARTVSGMVQSLKWSGLEPWIDDADVQFGHMLREGLQTAIGECRTLVLVWSKSAANSRWVNAELLTAFHLNRFIVPCVLDSTPLPQFLQSVAYLDRRRDKARLGEKLAAAVRAAPNGRNKVAPLLASQSPELKKMIATIAATQQREMQALGERNFIKCKKIHAALDDCMKVAERTYRFELMILNLAGYHRKNAYMLKHWEAIQAGRAPPDPLLGKAERCFFEALCVYPLDPSALNGLGSILMFERELDAAEFFQRCAIGVVKQDGREYPEAQHDLDLVLYYKRQANRAP